MMKICLNMIVRNEASVIQRCLASVAPHIDCWVIVDTGSEDGTQQIVKETLAHIPGELYERPWRDFAHNRNEALELARDKADFYLFIDADEILEGFVRPALDCDCYLVELQLEQGVAGLRLLLANANGGWRWSGVLHEELVSQQTKRGEVLSARLLVKRDGNRSKDPEKFLKEIEILEEGLKSEPGNTRYLFYLARAYELCSQYDKAKSVYQKRAEGGGAEEEIFYALYRIGWLSEKLQASSEEIIAAYTAAHQRRPTRAEPLFCLAAHLFRKGELLAAYAIAKAALALPLPRDFLFLERSIYDYQLLALLADCASALGKTGERQTLLAQLLSHASLPTALRSQIEALHG